MAAPAHEAFGADDTPKVEPIEEGDLCREGYRSQKELSVVSKNKVWSLVKGYIGGNASEAAILIRDKAVASRHAEVFTINPTGETDGYWIANANTESTTNLLLSAERGVRTRAALAVGSVFKVGAEVQLELVRVELKPRGSIADALSRFHTHASVSDMFGHLESMAAKFDHLPADARVGFEAALSEGLTLGSALGGEDEDESAGRRASRGASGRTLLGSADAVATATDGGAAAGGASGGGAADGSGAEETERPAVPPGGAKGGRPGSTGLVAGESVVGQMTRFDDTPIRKASHNRHVRFNDVTYSDESTPCAIGPSWWDRSPTERDSAMRHILGGARGSHKSFLHRREARAPVYVMTMQVLAGPQAGDIIHAASRDGAVVIGSDPTCDLVITGAEVSPVHARVSFTESEGPHDPDDIFGTLRPQRAARNKEMGVSEEERAEMIAREAKGAGGGSAELRRDGLRGEGEAGSDSKVIAVKPYAGASLDTPVMLDRCWIQDLAIGNRHGTQVAIGADPVTLQRGDIIVLCKQLLLEPPEGTWIGTPHNGAAGSSTATPAAEAGASDGSGAVTAVVAVGGGGDRSSSAVVPYGGAGRGSGGAGAGRGAKGPPMRYTPYALADRVELAILFHSETAAPPVLWSRLALRVTRTRRSRRKSLHRTATGRFPSQCVTVGPAGAVIGRCNKCDVLVDDLTAANFHTQIVSVQEGYVLQTIAHPDFFGTFILLGRHSSPDDRYRHESKGLYQLEMNDIFKCGVTEFFVEEIKTETFFELKRRQAALKQRVKLLRRSPLFSLLPDLDLTRIANAAVKVHADEGDVLIQEGEVVNKDACFFFIERGTVSVGVRRRDGSGSEVINSLGPGQCFGEMAMLAADRPRAATITARSKLTCYSLDWRSSKELLGPVMSAAMALIAEKREISIRMQLLGHLFPDVAASFGPTDFRLLAEGVTPVSFEAGETVVRQGQECTCVFFVVGGTGDMTVDTSEGAGAVPGGVAAAVGGGTDPKSGDPSVEADRLDAATVATRHAIEADEGVISPGATIGDVALLLNAPHTCTVTARQPLAVLALTKDAFQVLLAPLARWLLKRWAHIEAVRKVLGNMSKDTQTKSRSINLKELSKQGSALDMGLGDGQSAQGVMQVAAAQHARSRMDKWKSGKAIRSSENSIVSFSSRDGDNKEETIDNINKSLTDLDLAEVEAAEGHNASAIRQSLPPDIGWTHGAKPGPDGTPPPGVVGARRLQATQSFPAYDSAAHGSIFEAAGGKGSRTPAGTATGGGGGSGSGSGGGGAEASSRRSSGGSRRSSVTGRRGSVTKRRGSRSGAPDLEPAVTLAELTGQSGRRLGVDGGEAETKEAASASAGAAGGGAATASAVEAADDSGDGSPAEGADASDAGAGHTSASDADGEGELTTATEAEDVSDAAGEEGAEGEGGAPRRRRRKIRYAPRMRIPVSSTNPTVEEVKMLSQIPRFLILRALSGPLRGTYFYVTSDVTTIGGASGDATIVIPDRTLSPAHACIEYQDGAFWLRDLFSSTGTFLKLAAGKDYTMEMGDVFTIGHVELMVLGKPEVPPENPAAPASRCCTVL